MAIVSRVREARHRRGKKQAEVCAAVGITPQFYSAIEAGRKFPSIENALKICAALDCGLRDLYEIAQNYPEQSE